MIYSNPAYWVLHAFVQGIQKVLPDISRQSKEDPSRFCGEVLSRLERNLDIGNEAFAQLTNLIKWLNSATYSERLTYPARRVAESDKTVSSYRDAEKAVKRMTKVIARELAQKPVKQLDDKIQLLETKKQAILDELNKPQQTIKWLDREIAELVKQKKSAEADIPREDTDE